MLEQYNRKTSNIFLTDNTQGISISDLDIVDVSKYDLAQELNIPFNELEKSDNWYYYQGDIYYVKNRSFMHNIINELLGEYMSSYMNLPTIRQTLLLGDNSILGLASKNFRESGIKYVKANRLSFREHDKLNKVLMSRPTIFNHHHKKEMYNYIMRNFYTNQCDRVNNVLCYYRFRSIYLAPLYDYEMSFISPEDSQIIDPYFLGIDITPHFIKRLAKRDKSMQSSIDKKLDFKMDDALEYLCDYYGLFLPDDLCSYYQDFDRKRKDLIKKRLIK